MHDWMSEGIWILCCICVCSNPISAKQQQFRILQIKQAGKMHKPWYCSWVLATVMRCLVAYPSCILTGHMRFLLSWSFPGSKEDEQSDPPLVFSSESKCAPSCLLCLASSRDLQGKLLCRIALDSNSTRSDLEETTEWLMPAVILTIVSELLIVRSPEVTVTPIAMELEWRRQSS